MKNLIRKIIKEELEQNNLEKTSFDFNKATYIPETKSMVAPYMIIDEDDKSITVLNIKEIVGNIFLDNAIAYDITIHRVTLPKSHVEILSDVPGMEGFKFIKIPYWFWKNNSLSLDISRIKGGWTGTEHKKRLSIPVKKLMNSTFISNFKDPNVVKYISITNPEKKTNELIHSYAEKGFEPL